MENKIKVILGVLTLVYFLFCGGIAIAQDFSADIVSKTEEGVSKGRVFAIKDKVRIEMKEAITISRMDKNVIWLLMPAEKMYMELPLRPQNIVISTDKMSGEIARNLIGKELVDGKMVDKYEVIYALDGKKESIFVWIPKGSKFPIKTSAVDGSWAVEYKNITMGKHPDSLFKIPAGYQKFSSQIPDIFGEGEE